MSAGVRTSIGAGRGRGAGILEAPKLAVSPYATEVSVAAAANEARASRGSLR
jgi:hypothetical protein